LERCGPVDIGVDAAHHVVHDGPYRNQFFDGVDVLVFETQFPNEREFGVDDLLAQMSEV
jgi:hypothetical protein